MAHCAPAFDALGIREGAVVLVGNPNVGKSVVFDALTGTYVDVSNFPGTTVEITRGRMGDVDVVDTPGIYGVSSFNEEETVARDVVLAGDIVNVVDAVHLERDLFLTLQLADMGIPDGRGAQHGRRGAARGRRRRPRPARGPARRAGGRDRRGQGRGASTISSAASDARPGHADPEL